MKNKLFSAIKLAITALLFYFIFRKMDIRLVGAELLKARFDILIAAFIILWIGHVTCIYRWRMLMRPLMAVPSLSNLLGIYCIGLFFNLVFPSVVGGDVLKIYYAGKPSRKYAQSFAATFLDRDAGMLAMMIIACIAIIIHPVDVPGIPVSLIIWSVFALFIAGNVAIFTPSFHRLLTGVLHRLHLSKIAVKIDMISNAFQIMGGHKSVLWGSLAISLVNQFLVISATWITALGLHLSISLSYFLISVPVITLITMIPITPSGLGVRENSFKSLFGAIGIAGHSSVALGIISSIIIILCAIPGGIIYIFFRNRADLQQIATLETEFS
jgi:glycosyltransferase 2 family protein